MDNTHTKRPGISASWVFSAVGVILVFLLLVVANIIVRRAMPIQIDLTEDKLHTLSDGTKDILTNLDTPVKLSYFVSKDGDNMLPELATYAEKVDALLEDYEGVAKGDMLEIERVDPEPDSEEEDRAKLNNLQSIPGRLGEPVYLGITATCLDRKASIPLLLPNRDQLLEYEISRAIVEVTREEPPKIGILSALPVTGSGMPNIPGMPPQAQQRPWFFYNVLKRDYDPDRNAPESNVVSLEMGVEDIPDDIDVLVVVHPGGISDKTEFAIDQFVLRGGRLIAFLDPFSVVAAQSQPPRQQFGQQPPGGPPTSSNLPTILPAWGVSFEANQVLADRTFESQQRGGEINPTVLSISAEGIKEDDALTNNMRDLLFYMSGVYYIEDKEGIEAEVLVHSSEKSQLVASSTAQFAPGDLVGKFEASGKEYPLVVRLTGTFQTAFPDGRPGEEEEAETAEEGEGEKEDKPSYLKQSEKEGSVLLVADTDMLYDGLSVSRSLFGMQYNNHNLPLLEGAVEQAAGGANLISVRSRGSTSRPFNKFKELRAKASEKLTEEIAKVEEKEREFTSEIQKLMQEQGNSQMVVLSAEAQQKIEELRKQQVEASKRRRELNRELRKDINKIENGIKLANILIVPLLVLLVGIAHLVIRRIQVSAR